jgi:hypothetical protein
MSANDSEYLLSPSDFEEMWANQVASGQNIVVFADKSVFEKWQPVLGGDIKVLAEDGKEVVFTN